jgi:hypothetical protein
MATKLACRLGRHDWTTRVEEGESYKVCASCGTTAPDSRRSAPESERRGLIGEEAGNLGMGWAAISGPAGVLPGD